MISQTVSLTNCKLANLVHKEAPEGNDMSFGIYMIGFIILIIGLALGAHLMHIPAMWIGVGVIVMVGLGILLGVTSTRRPDPS